MDSKALMAKIEAGFLKGSEVDQKHLANLPAFKEGEHMDESYLEHDEEIHLTRGIPQEQKS